jgi:hypothetical protein
MPARTMTQTPTVENVYTVSKDGATVLETYVLAEALVKRRAVGGVLVTTQRNTSPT